jgi:hypothetical protein
MQKQSVDKRTITLHLGCGRRRYKFTIPLKSEYYDEWYEQRLKQWNIEPKDISAVEIGPRTVVELYSSAFFEGDRRIIKNPSFSEYNKYEIGCLEDHQIWHGNIRSFRLWDFDFYQKINSMQACTDNSECKENEYCLCPNGYARGEWCPKTGKFCFPVSRYLQSKHKNINGGDIVNLDCLSNKLGTKRYGEFSKIKRDSESCYGPGMVESMCSVGINQGDCGSCGMPGCGIPYYSSMNRANIEGFSMNPRYKNIMLIILITIVIYYLYTKF